jgi:hypothetical protein
LKIRHKSILVTTLLILGLFAVTQLALAAFGTNRANVSNITTAGIDAGYPSIAISQNGQNLGVVFAQTRDGGQAIQGPIYFRGGAGNPPTSLSTRVFVDNANSTTDQSLVPDIASDPGTQTNMHIVWRNLIGSGGSQTNRILYARCTTTSISCGNDEHTVDQTITPTDQGDTLNDPVVTANASNLAPAGVHVVWQHDDQSAGTEKIWYSARSNTGSWTPEFNVSGGDNHASRPVIAASRASDGTNYVHVVWVNEIAAANAGNGLNDQVRYRRGTVGGNGTVTAWGAIEPIPALPGTPGTTYSHPDYPAVAALGDIVIILWDVYAGPESALDDNNEPVNEQYYAVYSVSYNKGNPSTFSSPADVGDDSTTLGNYVARRSDDNEFSGTPPFLDSTVHASRLQIRAEMVPSAGVSGTLHIVWHQTTEDAGGSDHNDVYYGARSFASGNDCGEGPDSCTWDITNETTGYKDVDPKAYSASPDITVDSNSVPAKLYGVYMESNEEAGFDVDEVTYNVYYNGTEPITIPSDGGSGGGGGGIFLPVVLKNSTN